MKQLTVDDLLAMCQKEVNAGNGGKHIVVADDNEGNGYHGLFSGFSTLTFEEQSLVYDTNYSSEKDTIILG